MKAVDVLISGRVQRVGFRDFTKKNAVLIGIKGYVENMGDGKVHAVLEGEAHQIDKMLETIRHGPMVSQVREVNVTEIESAGYQGFEIR